MSYDVVSYRFKRLKENGFFLWGLAQPSEKMLHLHIDMLIFKVKNLEITDLLRYLKNVGRIPYFFELEDNKEEKLFAVQTISLDYNDFKNSLDKIYNILDEKLVSLRYS